MSAKPRKSVARLQSPPRHLRADGKELWKRVIAEYDLPPEALLILEHAAAAQDRCAAAKKVLDKDGVTFNDRFGQPKMRPEFLIERDARSSVARLLRQLGLDLEPVHEKAGRPPGK